MLFPPIANPSYPAFLHLAVRAINESIDVNFLVRGKVAFEAFMATGLAQRTL